MLRYCEGLGVGSPVRSDGRYLLYSEHGIEKFKSIARLRAICRPRRRIAGESPETSIAQRLTARDQREARRSGAGSKS
ncbi:hypothetical protein WL32_17735 [Burkholderia cepacia]|nr:hypothetical protein WL32_17735 [Burkholderia cepacia]